MYTKQDAIDSLQEAAEILEETPSIRQYETLGLSPSRSVIQSNWGWQDTKQEAGLELLDVSSRTNSEIDPKPDDVEIPETANWEDLSPHMRWYYKNPEKAKHKAAERRKKNRKERVPLR